jgi:hypothetical protein
MATIPQGIYWLGTMKYVEGEWDPATLISEEIVWVKGQQEVGAGGFHHWQFVFALSRKQRLNAVKKYFEPMNPHLELTKSKAAEDYVHKDDTAVLGTKFEYSLI